MGCRWVKSLVVVGLFLFRGFRVLIVILITMVALITAVHYGTKPGHFETSIIHFPTSEGLSEVSEQANE